MSAYVIAVLERAVKTAAQSAILIFIAGQVSDGQVNAFTVDWLTVLGFALGGFVLSVLTSLATSGFGNTGPSVRGETLVRPAGDDHGYPAVRDDHGVTSLTVVILVAAAVAVLCVLVVIPALR